MADMHYMLDLTHPILSLALSLIGIEPEAFLCLCLTYVRLLSVCLSESLLSLSLFFFLPPGSLWGHFRPVGSL